MTGSRSKYRLSLVFRHLGSLMGMGYLIKPEYLSFLAQIPLSYDRGGHFVYL